MIALSKLTFGCQSCHLLTVITVKTVTTDHDRIPPFSGKHAAENLPGSGGSSSRGASNCNDRMTFGHNGYDPELDKTVEQPGLLDHKSLSVVDTQLGQYVQHIPRFDLRSNNLPVHVVCHFNHGTHHCPISFTGSKLVCKGTVDLDQINRQRSHKLERTRSTAKVAQAEPTAKFFHLKNKVRYGLDVVDR